MLQYLWQSVEMVTVSLWGHKFLAGRHGRLHIGPRRIIVYKSPKVIVSSVDWVQLSLSGEQTDPLTACPNWKQCDLVMVELWLCSTVTLSSDLCVWMIKSKYLQYVITYVSQLSQTKHLALLLCYILAVYVIGWGRFGLCTTRYKTSWYCWNTVTCVHCRGRSKQHIKHLSGLYFILWRTLVAFWSSHWSEPRDKTRSSAQTENIPDADAWCHQEADSIDSLPGI